MAIIYETARRLLGREQKRPDPVKRHTAELLSKLELFKIKEVVRSNAGSIGVVSELGEAYDADFVAIVAYDQSIPPRVVITATEHGAHDPLGIVELDFQGRIISDPSYCLYIGPSEVVSQIAHGLDVIDHLDRLPRSIRDRVSERIRIKITPPHHFESGRFERRRLRVEPLFPDRDSVDYSLRNGVGRFEAIRNSVRSFIPPATTS